MTCNIAESHARELSAHTLISMISYAKFLKEQHIILDINFGGYMIKIICTSSKSKNYGFKCIKMASVSGTFQKTLSP